MVKKSKKKMKKYITYKMGNIQLVTKKIHIFLLMQKKLNLYLVRKLLQAAGRVVRSETDRGFIVVTDNRTGRFLEYIPELEQSDDIISEINEFFEA